MTDEPILIWGAGAIGGTIGAFLKHAGTPVVLVDAAPAHVMRIREHGLKADGVGAGFTAFAPAYAPGDVKGTFRRVILSVKAHQTAQAVRQLYRHLADDGTILSAQRGLNVQTIAQLVGETRALGAFVAFSSVYRGPGHVERTARGRVLVGEIGGRLSPRAEAWAETLRALEPEAATTDNLRGWLWGGLARTALLYATALTGEPVADVLSMTEFRDVMFAIGVETMSAALLEDVDVVGHDGFDPGAFVPSAELEELQASLDAMAAHHRTAGPVRSDFWADLAEHRRKTEVDAHVGSILDAANRHDLETPVLRRLQSMIHEIEDGRRPISLANLDELARVVDPTGAPRLR
jgi:2-dehydropantoate 2-reductase